MQNKKGFTLIELLVVISIIGILALMGLRLYLDQLRDEAALYIAENAGLHNPFNGVSMNLAGWFPESADAPGEIQITLSSNIFYIQGYGSDGLLPDILTARR